MEPAQNKCVGNSVWDRSLKICLMFSTIMFALKNITALALLNPHSASFFAWPNKKMDH